MPKSRRKFGAGDRCYHCGRYQPSKPDDKSGARPTVLTVNCPKCKKPGLDVFVNQFADGSTRRHYCHSCGSLIELGVTIKPTGGYRVTTRTINPNDKPLSHDNPF